MPAAPRWARSTGSALAIALSSLPLVLAVPGVVDAHRSLDRQLDRHRTVATAATHTADVAVAVAEQSILATQ
ncbi:MAG: hypothetical protein IT200_08265 [Thermoleophilia bacterium]|nr:hypothetical protein [Thermoleophilia bacterium]